MTVQNEMWCQEAVKAPLAWAFQKESELHSIMNYHLDKMEQSGIIDRLHKTFLKSQNINSDTDAIMTKVYEEGIGYDKVVVPFLVLLTGLCLALLQLGIEAIGVYMHSKSSKHWYILYFNQISFIIKG